ncbi:hypothetical protein DsansV1_C12g0114311 [Dioscorea sansibarensis]
MMPRCLFHTVYAEGRDGASGESQQRCSAKLPKSTKPHLTIQRATNAVYAEGMTL